MPTDPRSMELTINDPGPDTPIRFNLSGVQVWARTREHAYQLLNAHTRQLLPESASDPHAAPCLQGKRLMASLSDAQILAELRSPSLLNRVRKAIHQSAGRIEQALAQRKRPTPLEIRRMEFEDAAGLIELIRAEPGEGA